MAGCTASARVVEWDSEPLLPLAVMVKLPVAALSAAPRTMAVFAPAAMLKGLTGFDRTPLGKPASVTWTAPVNPFWPATETVRGALVAPCESDSELEESVIEKSEGGRGGWTFADALPLPPPPPPHPAHTAGKRTKMLIGTPFRNRATPRQLRAQPMIYFGMLPV